MEPAAICSYGSPVPSGPAGAHPPSELVVIRSGCRALWKRPDKDWSFVDCTSFITMKNERLIEALTEDHHFEQAGYRALLNVR